MLWLVPLPVDGAIVTLLVGTAVTESDGTTTAAEVAGAVAEGTAEVGAPAELGTGTADSVVPSVLLEPLDRVLELPVRVDVGTCVRVWVGTAEVWTGGFGEGVVLLGLGVTDGVLLGFGVTDAGFVGVAEPVFVGVAEVDTDVLVTGTAGVVVTAGGVVGGAAVVVAAAGVVVAAPVVAAGTGAIVGAA